jgi:hypothetical protein
MLTRSEREIGPVIRPLAPSPRPDDVLLHDVLGAARRFLDLQARAVAAQSAQAPASLADAIERDFLLFDLHDAARDLRDAVSAAEQARLRAQDDLPRA